MSFDTKYCSFSPSMMQISCNKNSGTPYHTSMALLVVLDSMYYIWYVPPRQVLGSQWSVKTQMKWFPLAKPPPEKSLLLPTRRRHHPLLPPFILQRAFKVGHLEPISELEAKDHLLLAEDFPTIRRWLSWAIDIYEHWDKLPLRYQWLLLSVLYKERGL